MAVVLYVNAHPLDRSACHSLSVGHEIIHSIRQAHEPACSF
ncbi:hypothetical protein SAMN05428962_6174 [Paenibacillus sp. BC26]|nr:hypothetical protein SAMN05428962_6174 [Paenibacillus sp. BC26]